VYRKTVDEIAAELPLIYAKGRRAEMPDVNFPGAVDLESKPPRVRESKLESEPLLRSLPVYRYSSPLILRGAG
jgi:hypothetical protein